MDGAPSMPRPAAAPAQAEPDDDIPTDWELDAHDRSLVNVMLALTPSERLRRAQGFATSVYRLRRGRRA